MTERDGVRAGAPRGPESEGAATRRVETTEADGRTVGYAEFGDGDGDAALFCHGTPGSHVSGALLAAGARERGVHLLCPDRPGIGGTDPLPAGSIADRATDAVAVLDEAGADAVPVVGFSGGAPHALALAAARPSRVSKLVLVCPTAPPEAPRGDVAPEIRVVSALGRYAPFLLGPLLAAQVRMLGDASPEKAASLYGDPEGVRSAVSDPESVFEVLSADFDAAFRRGTAGVARELRLFERSWGFDARDVAVETTVHYGRADRNAPPAAVRWLTERMPAATERAHEGDHLTAFLRARERVCEELS